MEDFMRQIKIYEVEDIKNTDSEKLPPLSDLTQSFTPYFMFRGSLEFFSFNLSCCVSDCVKGYYKRAKAHAAVWNEKEARRDYNMVATLDVTLASLVGRELRAFSERMKEKYWEEKEAYWNMLEKKESSDDVLAAEEPGSGELQTRVESRAEEEDEEKEKKAAPSEGGGEELSPGASVNREEPRSGDIIQRASNLAEGKDWQQMLQTVMLLQREGNVLIKDKRFQDAEEKFREALDYMDTLQHMVSGFFYFFSTK